MPDHKKKITHAIFAILMMSAVFTIPECRAEDKETLFNRPNDYSKSEKVILTNVAGNMLVCLWGITHWDYGSRGPHARMEGWFGQNTLHGGADKTGHMYSNYAVGQLLARQYEDWGYSRESAARYGAYSALMIHTVMEVGDSFSAFGFSIQDYGMNVLGASLGYLIYHDPAISPYVDIRVEYIPTFQKYDVTTDYDGLKYLAAFKLSAFPVFKKTPLDYVELKAGYYARGYELEGSTDKQRNLYAAIGFNLSRLFDLHKDDKAAKLFTYIEVPYTYAAIKTDLNK